MKGIKKVLKRERIAKWKMEKPFLLPNWNLSLNLGKSIKTQNSNIVLFMSGGELLEMRLLDSHLLDTFGSKSIARHEIDKLLESS